MDDMTQLERGLLEVEVVTLLRKLDIDGLEELKERLEPQLTGIDKTLVFTVIDMMIDNKKGP